MRCSPQLPPGSFDASITGDEVTSGKPHPEPYLAAAAALGVDPPRAWRSRTRPPALPRQWAQGVRRWEYPMSSRSQPSPVSPSSSPSPTLPSPISEPSSIGDTPVGGIDAVEPDGVAGADRGRVPRRRWLRRRRSRCSSHSPSSSPERCGWRDRESPPPPARPDIPRRRLGAVLDARRRALPEVHAIASMREVSPFWYHAVGVDQIVEFDRNAGAELTAADSSPSPQASTAQVVPSIVDALPAGGDGGAPRRSRRRGPRTSTRSPDFAADRRLRRHRHRLRAVRLHRRPRAPGRRPARTGWRSSPSSAPACTPTGGP